MPNVKVGDLARVLNGVRPPEWEGVQVLVQRPFDLGGPDRSYLRQYLQVCDNYGSPGGLLMWWVQLLQTVYTHQAWVPPVNLTTHAGDTVAILDRHLRRIPPPSEEAEELEIIVLTEKIDA